MLEFTSRHTDDDVEIALRQTARYRGRANMAYVGN